MNSSSAFSKPAEKPFAEIFPPPAIVECVADMPPSANEIHAAALKYARLAPEDISNWKKNIKWSAALPRLEFGYERRLLYGVRMDVNDTVSVTTGGTAVGPTASEWDRNQDLNNNIEVRAVWYLDELLFNRDSLSISSEARAHIGARREMLNEITDAYFDLKRLMAIYLMKSGMDGRLKGDVRLEMEKLIGRLDLATGGWFSGEFNWRNHACR